MIYYSQMKRACSILGFCLCLAALAGCGNNLELAKDSRTDYAVVVDRTAADEVKFVARDLSRVLKKVTGADFPLVEEGDPVLANRRRIEVGTARGRRIAGERRCAALKHNGALAASVGSDVVLVGADTFGVAGAVYDFLQKQVGCRWWTPMDEQLPSAPSLSLAPFETIVNPPLECRWLITLQNVTDRLRNGNLFLIRNGFNTNGERQFPNMDFPEGMTRFRTEFSPATRLVHTLQTFVPAHDKRDYFGKHPEWFAWQKASKRRIDDRQLCFSNPGLRAEFTKNFLAAVGQKGGYGVYSITQEDYPGPFCECAECLKLVEKYRSDGGPLYDYVAEVAPKLKAQYPEALLDIIAYHKEQTQHPPKGGLAGYPDNVVLTFAPIDDDLSKPMDHPNNRGTLKDLEDWSRLVSRIWTWYYPQPYSIVMCSPYSGVRRAAKDLRLMIARGMTGAKYEHDVGREEGANFFDLHTWVFGRMFREPEADVEALVKEFCRGYYGAAADVVWRYWDDLERIVAECPDYEEFNHAPMYAYTAENLLRWNAMLAEAEEKVKGDATLVQRVRECRFGTDVQLLARYGAVSSSGLAGVPPADEVRARLTNTCLRAYARRGRKVTQAKALHDIEDYYTVAKAKNLKPAELRDVPDGRIVHVIPSCTGSGRVRIDDPESAFGYAFEDKDEAAAPSPCLPVRVYDTNAKRILAERRIAPEVMTEGRYALYKIGRFVMPRNASIIFGTSWRVQRGLAEYYQPGVDVEYDLYASIRFDGPKYFKNAKSKENHAAFGRAILVRTRQGGNKK